MKEDWSPKTKVKKLEIQLVENANLLPKISEASDKQINSKLESMQNSFEEKLDNILAKQIEFPREIKTWNISQTLRN